MTLVPLLLAGTGLAAGSLHPAPDGRPGIRPPAGPAPAGGSPPPARDGRPETPPPRVDTTVTVDGRLDEPVWARAALLNGFSQYAPNDGVPASDRTRALVWYSS